MINFPAVSASVQLDELFAQGQHTDYNIALRNGPESDAGDASPSQPDIAGIIPETLRARSPAASQFRGRAAFASRRIYDASIPVTGPT